jgi:multiple sugar transport system permease protein
VTGVPRRAPGWTRAVLVYAPLSVFTVFVLFPFLWMALVSLKTNQELYNLDAFPFWVRQPTLEHFAFLFRQTSFATWFWNSLVVSVCATAISLVAGTLAAYGLARIPFRGSAGLALAIFVSYLVPTSLLFLPLSIVVRFLGLANTSWALVVTYPLFLIPFCTWLLMAYLETVPRELEESAMLDGCGRLRALVHIILPVIRPGLVCVGLFSFTLSWQEFIFALTFVSSTGQKTLPPAIVSELIRGDVYFWGSLMAACLLGSVPIALLYSWFLDSFVAGLTMGSVKA